MLRSPDSSFTTTILLPAGTHHFRFVVDGLIVVAPSNEIANAVDDQGFITNYVTVPGPAVTASAMPTTSTPLPVLSMAANKPPPVTLGRSTSGRNKQRRPSLPVHPDGSFWDHNSVDGSEDARGRVGERGSRPHGKGKSTAAWTTEIPEELFAAAKQEEDWLSAQSEHQHHNHTRHLERGRHAGIALNGFPVEPTIPLAAKLPRHLERLILNRPSPGVVIPRVGTGAGNVGLSTVISPYGSGHLNGSPALRVTTASGTDVTMPPHSMMMGMASLTPSSHPPSPTPLKESPGATGGTPLIADDPSVLQTPSHAVLYHLCTSSIRDKMIAVGASTRYRQKYLTTVYYKPAEPGVWEE
ncbi:5'-AMP-activated protein kinase beta subunit, interation domain-containing protein [Mycena amicta]|nr:5'-AMP-activated protein kinase beta subunit, interation domain-containing protein [Mycena amicta]